MNADGLRRLDDFQFALNHCQWERAVLALAAEQFRRPVGYAVGSLQVASSDD